MKFEAAYLIKEQIYDKSLQEVSGVKFTSREIDIISCIVHNRGEKKIAALLAISHRTVSSHMRNIMIKLGCSSKDIVIDVLEKSGKGLMIRQYYYYLMLHSLFHRQLRKAALVNYNLIYCLTAKDGLPGSIATDLSLANVKLLEQKAVIKDQKIKYNIHIINKQEDNKIYLGNDTESIILLFDDSIDPTVFMERLYIDFTEEQNYYPNIFKLLKIIIDKQNIDQIILEFEQEYQALQNSLRGTSFNQDNVTKMRPIKFQYNVLLIMLFVAFSSAIVLKFFIKDHKLDISRINNEFAVFAQTFSSDNMTTENRQKNFELLSRVEKVFTSLQDQSIQTYFQNDSFSQNELINCLYSLHALANSYAYNENDGQKARKILIYAKDVAEKYICSKNHLLIEFDQLGEEELYVELNIIKGLPEIYTRIMYSLGKTYIYHGNIADSVKYFNIGKYLGNKLGIFEGYLSDRSGLEVIKRMEIEDMMMQGEYELAKQKIKNSIKANQELRDDNKEYKINFNPNSIEIKTIIPKADMFSQLFCGEQIVRNYARLLLINKSNKKRVKYAQRIVEEFVEGKSSERLGLIELSKRLAHRGSASIYNTLGNILLKFYQEKINLENFNAEIVKQLGLKPVEDLEIIQQIFDIARLKSRNNDYTKADAYDGLARVYQYKLQHLDIYEANKLRLQIQDLHNKRDQINTRLNRVDWRLRANQI